MRRAFLPLPSSNIPEQARNLPPAVHVPFFTISESRKIFFLPTHIDRRNKEFRQKITAAVNMQGRGWITGRLGGRPWTLSRTKRASSACVAALLLLGISPLLIIIAVTIKLSSPGPVFFVQQRTGFRGRRFGMVKFRTMTINAEALKDSIRHLNKHGPNSVDFKVERDPRITGIGHFLRRTSLDELPNLFNVLRGDMRLVGPRPTSFHAQKYQDFHLHRLSTYPGITGLWQVSGRSDLDFDDRVTLDTRYIIEQSPWLDLKIVLKTPIAVLAGQGAG